MGEFDKFSSEEMSKFKAPLDSDDKQRETKEREAEQGILPEKQNIPLKEQVESEEDKKALQELLEWHRSHVEHVEEMHNYTGLPYSKLLQVEKQIIHGHGIYPGLVEDLAEKIGFEVVSIEDDDRFVCEDYPGPDYLIKCKTGDKEWNLFVTYMGTADYDD